MIDNKLTVSELRIGNLVQHAKTCPCKPEYIGTPHRIDLKSLEHINCDYPFYEPIPVTPEILEKAGFVRPPKGLNFNNPILYIDKGKYNYLATNGSNEYVFLNGVRVTCQHLHQLQNLYFALTGSELQIEL